MTTASEQTVGSLSMSRVLLAIAGVALVALALIIGAGFMPEALKYFFGFTTANATAAAGAILAGMDVATAVMLFGGATAIGSVALAALRRAIGRKALVR